MNIIHTSFLYSSIAVRSFNSKVKMIYRQHAIFFLLSRLSESTEIEAIDHYLALLITQSRNYTGTEFQNTCISRNEAVQNKRIS